MNENENGTEPVDVTRPDTRITTYAFVGLIAALMAGIYSPELLPAMGDGLSLTVRVVGTFVVLGVVLFAAHRIGALKILAELGFDRSPVRGLGWAFILTSPMLIGILVARRGVLFDAEGIAAVTDRPWTFVASWAGAGLIEETIFRGFFFRQLVRRGRWSSTRAMILCGVIFGLLHIPPVWGQSPGQILGVVAITGIGGAAFCWLLKHWNWNLWFLIGWHALVNLYWTLGQAGDNAIGDGFSNILRIAVIVLTFWFTMSREKFPPRVRALATG